MKIGKPTFFFLFTGHVLFLSNLVLADEAPKPSSAKSIALEECFTQKDFSLNLFVHKSPAGVSKEACTAKIVLFRGEGKRWSIDLCNPEIAFIYQSPLDALKPKIFSPGSAHCPSPLFGIDLKNPINNTSEFEKTQTELMALLKDIRSDYLKREDIDSVGGQLICLERLLKRYLEECVPFAKIEKTSKGKFSEPTKIQPLPIDILPAEIAPVKNP